MLGSGLLNNSGNATFTTGSGISGLAVGTHTITAVYQGDVNFLTSTSNPLRQTVKQGILVFVQQPTNTIAGHTMVPVVVAIEDTQRRLDTTNNSFVTLSVASGPSGAALGGTLSVQAQNGQATFSNLFLTKAGNYTFLATDDIYVGQVQVLHGQPGDGLFAPCPRPTVGQHHCRQVLAPALVVDVQDQYGNIVTADHSKATLSIVSGSTTGTFTGTPPG